MSVTLTQILKLVGKLDDTAGPEAPRDRFRLFIEENVKEVGQIRDYIQECLANSGDQYNRALQDLVNHSGRFLGFEVKFGRYRGVRGEVGFDGHWKSPKGFHVVVEVKTTEAYAIRTATLDGYISHLISRREIPDRPHALGLYVVGRPDPEVRQLENAIVAENRTHELRIISVESLLSLTELMNEYDMNHEDILSVLWPSGPIIDSVVDLMARLVAQGKAEVKSEAIEESTSAETEARVNYWITPVKSDEEQSAEDVIRSLVGEEHVYAISERTPGRKRIKQGDWMCFYATTEGVVAHARITTNPEKRPYPAVREPDKYNWVFRLEETQLYLDAPVVIDTSLRDGLDAFHGRDPNKSWAWFVQATRSITQHDFRILTRTDT
ncbi:MAG: EVE domain-containing protein [Dehalococcoidia bacterium]